MLWRLLTGALVLLAQGVQSERDVLEALYWATNGPEWAADARWDLDDDADWCNSWAGVSCQANATTHLALSGAGLVGTLPTELGLLSQLETINVATNAGLTGPIPTELGSLTRLREVVVAETSVTGSIPWQLARAGAMEQVLAHFTQISSAEEFLAQGSDTVIAFYCHDSLANHTLSLQGQWPALRSVDFSNSLMYGTLPEDLPQRAPALTVLHADELGLTGTIPDAYLSDLDLERLYLAHNQLEGSIPSNHPAASMAHIDLEFNALTGTLPDFLASTVTLEVAGNRLNGTIPATWDGEYLHLTKNNFTGSAMPMSELTRVIDYTASENPFLESPSTWPVINTTTLRQWELAHNGLDGPLPEWNSSDLATRCGAQSVVLSHNNFQGPIPASWRDALTCPGLLLLELQSNNLTGEISLDVFDIDAMQVASGDSTGILMLALDDNPLDCPVPDEIRCWDNKPFVLRLPACGDLYATAATPTTGSTAVVDWEPLEYAYGEPLGFAVQVEAMGLSIDCDSAVGCVAGAGERICNVSGLDADTQYDFIAQPFYSWGNSTAMYTTLSRTDAIASTTGSATTLAGLPRAVSGVAIDWVEKDRAQVSWQLLDFGASGGFPVTQYRASTSSTAFCDTAGDSCVVSGLAVDAAFTASVVATNVIGSGPVSASVGGRTCDEFQLAAGTRCFDCYGPGCDGSRECRTGFEQQGLCSTCVHGRYQFATECESCTNAAWQVAVAAVVIVAALCVAQRLDKTSVVAGQLFWGLVTSLQLSFLALSYPAAQRIGQLAAVRSMLQVLVTLDLSAIHPECFISSDSQRWLLWHVLTVYVQPLVAVAVLRSLLRSPQFSERSAQLRLRNMATALFSMYVVPYTRAMLVALPCVELPSGERALIYDTEVLCDTAQHDVVQALVYVVFALLVLGLCWIAVVIRQLARSGKLGEPGSIRYYGSLYLRFRNEWANFQVVDMLRRVALVAVAIVLPAEPLLQVSLGCVISLAYFVVVVRVRPYQERVRTTSVIGQRLHRWLQRRQLVPRIDVANGMEALRSFSVVSLHLLLLWASLVDDVDDPAFFAAATVVTLAHGVCVVAVVVINARELSRGFRDVNVRVFGDNAIVCEIEYAATTLAQLSTARRYHLAAEVQDSIMVLRKAAADENVVVPLAPQQPAVPFRQQVLDVFDKVRESASAACPCCVPEPGTRQSVGVVVQDQCTHVNTRLSLLERAAVTAHDFAAAELIHMDRLGIGAIVLKHVTQHFEQHGEAGLAGLATALRHGDMAAGRAQLAETTRALDAMQQAALVFGRTTANTTTAVHPIVPQAPRTSVLGPMTASVPTWRHFSRRLTRKEAQLRRKCLGVLREVALCAGAPKPPSALDEQWFDTAPQVMSVEQWEAGCVRVRRRARRWRLARCVLGIAVVIVAVVAVVLVAAGSGSSGSNDESDGSDGGGADTTIDTDCFVLDADVPDCALEAGMVGSAALFERSSSDGIVEVLSSISQGIDLVALTGTALSDECEDGLLSLGCTAAFRPCNASCTAIPVCGTTKCPTDTNACTVAELEGLLEALLDLEQFIVAVVDQSIYDGFVAAVDGCVMSEPRPAPMFGTSSCGEPELWNECDP